jgi:Fic family protein
MNVTTGTFDAGKGEYRLCGVTAGAGRKSYMDYRKVPDKVNQLCDELNKRITGVKGLKEIYNLSFDAHFNLVTIHPWIDGNGRTSRLLMNYIQFYHKLMPTKVYKEDKAGYIDALQKSRDNEILSPFREFMAKQHLKNLQQEIRNYEQRQKKSNGSKLMF